MSDDKDNRFSKEEEAMLRRAAHYVEEAQYPPTTLLESLYQLPLQHPDVEDKTKTPPTSLRWRWWLIVPVSCAVLFGFWQLPPKALLYPPQNIRPKGAVWRVLYAHHKKSLTSHELNNGDVLYPGDFLQFTYQLPKSYYVQIVGINERGELYKLYPPDQDEAKKLHAGHGTLPRSSRHPRSFELDQYIGMERFFVLTSRQVFSFEQVRLAFQRNGLTTGRSIRSLTHLKGPWHNTSYWIIKRPPKHTKKTP